DRLGTAYQPAQVHEAQTRPENQAAQEDQRQTHPSCIYRENSRHANVAGRPLQGWVREANAPGKWWVTHGVKSTGKRFTVFGRVRATHRSAGTSVVHPPDE